MLANFNPKPQHRPSEFAAGRSVWGGAPPESLPPWSVYVSLRTG
jgi:hypothetical protein